MAGAKYTIDDNILLSYEALSPALLLRLCTACANVVHNADKKYFDGYRVKIIAGKQQHSYDSFYEFQKSGDSQRDLLDFQLKLTSPPGSGNGFLVFVAFDEGSRRAVLYIEGKSGMKCRRLLDELTQEVKSVF